MLTPRRLARMASVKLSMPEVLQWLCRAEATGKDVEEALKKWTQKTPAWAAILKVDAYATSGLGITKGCIWCGIIASNMSQRHGGNTHQVTAMHAADGCYIGLPRSLQSGRLCRVGCSMLTQVDCRQ